MKEDSTFNLVFSMPHIDPGFLKENEIMVIKNLINGLRLNKFINFYGIGTICFNEDDTKHWNPIVNIVDKFKRGKINCLCYKVNHSANPNSRYDYIFIYETNSKDSGFYGLVGYRKEDNYNVHLYGLKHDYSNLVINMQRLAKRSRN